MPGRTRPSGQRGQVLVIMAVGLVTMLTLAGLVIDGGLVFSQQRATQNGADAASNAGATVLAKGLKGVAYVADADVATAISNSAAANRVPTWQAYYTDVLGRTLRADGNVTPTLQQAVAVGGGTIPPCNDPTACVNGRASGVQVITSKPVNTYISGIIGINTITVTTQATAVAGFVTEICPAASGCDILPVTIPITQLTCDGSNNPEPVDPPARYDTEGNFIIPLCQNGPGNVGWLDWVPPYGGTSELASSITSPNNPEVSIPNWYYVAATGNINSSAVEDALNTYAQERQWVVIPQFDSTCSTQPLGTDLGDCPTGSVGGTGQNQWYHLSGFASFMFAYPKGAYINGSNPICNTGNGATSCLIGHFIDLMTGSVSIGPGMANQTATNVVGVQLIR